MLLATFFCNLYQRIHFAFRYRTATTIFAYKDATALSWLFTQKWETGTSIIECAVLTLDGETAWTFFDAAHNLSINIE